MKPLNQTNSLIILIKYDLLQLVAAVTPLSLVWVPGHNGISDNEIADTLASKEFIGQETGIKVPTSFQ